MKPPRPRPCASCPYRKDVPSGVWDTSEYLKLPQFDLPTAEQPTAVFLCHQGNDHLCGGWAACHDMAQNLGMRLASAFGHMSDDDIDATLDYQTSVELFESGAEAALHGMRDMDEPDQEAQRVINKVLTRRRAQNER